jgi:polyisoprenoid-binding protein YceI
MRSLGSFAALAAVALASVYAHAKYSRTGNANVSFLATGPAGLKINGTGSELEVVDGPDQLVLRVPLDRLDTGIELRNKHMREKYLETAKYPNAELVVARAEVPSGAATGEANGTMKLHGQSKPVRFQYTVKPNGKSSIVTGKVRVNLKDYGIEEPSFMGAKVRPDVDVSVAFSVQDS